MSLDQAEHEERLVARLAHTPPLGRAAVRGAVCAAAWSPLAVIGWANGGRPAALGGLAIAVTLGVALAATSLLDHALRDRTWLRTLAAWATLAAGGALAVVDACYAAAGGPAAGLERVAGLATGRLAEALALAAAVFGGAALLTRPEGVPRDAWPALGGLLAAGLVVAWPRHAGGELGLVAVALAFALVFLLVGALLGAWLAVIQGLSAELALRLWSREDA